MTKRKKHILSLEEDPAYDLIGLCTHHSDYRLAWSINETLGFHLCKADDFVMTDKKGQPVSEHSMYFYEDEEDRITYYLIKNKAQGRLMIGENPTIDYFLFLCDNHAVEVEDLVKQMKNVPSILAAYSFDPEELPSTDNIIFN